MNRNVIQFKIDQLRQERIVLGVEAIAVMVFCFLGTAFLPRLLFTYYFANQQLTEEPAVLTHLPLFFFVLGTASFVWALIASVMNKVKTIALEKELEKSAMSMEACCTDCKDCDCDDHGNCACDACAPVAAPAVASGSTTAMAAKMSTINRKRKTAKRK